jgi:5-methyltetrahydrofolate--homocysteine methyltransferase
VESGSLASKLKHTHKGWIMKLETIFQSALLTTTMGSMAEVIEAVEDINMRDKVKIIIGGAPVTPDYAEQIGADGFAADASSAVKKVRELLG